MAGGVHDVNKTVHIVNSISLYFNASLGLVNNKFLINFNASLGNRGPVLTKPNQGL